MRTRPFGAAKEFVSELGYGGWGIGGTRWGPTDDAESVKALEQAWDLGVTFFDTAYVYGDGRSERLMAKALSGKPAFIATKIPPKNKKWPPKKGDPISEAFPPDWIRHCVERSLKNLKKDALDLQQFHVWIDDWNERDEWKNEISKLKSEGKIRYAGVSVNDHDPESVLALVSSGLIDSVQTIFNIFDQSPKEKLFSLCRQKGVGIIARVPFDEGSLTGAFGPETKFEGDDFRQHYFKGDRLAEVERRTAKLKDYLGPEAQTLPELALRFVLSHSEVSTVIPGMRRPSRVRDNVAIVEKGPLSSDLVDSLKKEEWRRNFYGWWP